MCAWPNFPPPLPLNATFFFSPAPFSTAEVSDSRTVLLGNLQALDETSWPFLSRWLRHCKGAGQVQARAPYGGAGRRLGSGGGAGASARSRIIPFNIGKMGAVLVEEAGGKGLQGSMGQLGRPSVDEGSCHRELEEAGCLSGFRVREELYKTGGFFAPSASCFYAKDDEATSSAAHEFWVCALLSASGFGQGGSCILPGPAPWLAMLRSIVGWVPVVNGDWHDAMSRRNHKLQNAYRIYPTKSWSERILMGKFLNHWPVLCSRWQPGYFYEGNFNVQPRRLPGRPQKRWDDQLRIFFGTCSSFIMDDCCPSWGTMVVP